MEKKQTELITLDELCDILKTGKNTAYTLMRTGELEAFKIGRVWKIPLASVRKYIESKSTKNNPENKRTPLL